MGCVCTCIPQPTCGEQKTVLWLVLSSHPYVGSRNQSPVIRVTKQISFSAVPFPWTQQGGHNYFLMGTNSVIAALKVPCFVNWVLQPSPCHLKWHMSKHVHLCSCPEVLEVTLLSPHSQVTIWISQNIKEVLQVTEPATTKTANSRIYTA